VAGSKRRARLKLALMPAALVGSLLLAEVGLRLYHGKLRSWENLRSHFWMREFTEESESLFDARLGWVHRPGHYVFPFGRQPKGHWTTTIGADGLRENGKARPPGSPVLAVGASFTLGNEVEDDETWPACLERILERPVLNGGISSYGLDQVVLRTEMLLEEYEPDVVVLAYADDDIQRCQLSFYTGWKPYFDIEQGALSLRNSPVPLGTGDDGIWNPAPPPALSPLGYSYLARSVIMRLDPDWWLHGMGREHERGDEVAALLLLRAAREVRAVGAELLVVRLYPKLSGPVEHPLEADRALAEGAQLLDLGPEVIERRRSEGKDAIMMPSGHLSAAMNEWAAQRIADVLR
jgi:hypothetical protein